MNYYSAINIDSYEIKIAVGRKDNTGDIEIISFSKVKSRGVRRGIILNIINTSNDIKKVVKKIEVETRMKIDKVVCNINGQHVSRKQELGKEPLREFNNVFVQIAALRNLQKCLNNAGITTVHLIPESFSPLYAIKQVDVLVLNFGYDLINVSIKLNYALHHVLTIPYLHNPIEVINDYVEEIKSHSMFPFCSKVIVCGELSGDQLLFQTIQKLFLNKKIEYASFTNIKSKIKVDLYNQSNITLLGLIQYAASINNF